MATSEHCLACFETLDAHLTNRKPLSLDEIQALLVASPPSATSKALQDPTLRRLVADTESSSSSSTSVAASTPATSTSSLPLSPTSAPLFVTWNTMDDGDPVLRGCIGTFESQPLSEGIPEYSLVSALQDTRFSPIRKSELRTLQVAVTLLTDFEEADDKYDWEIGVHGIRLSFYDRGRRYGSTYLPDVASEQGWTQDETLFSLIRKAGWMGNRKHWKDLELKITRYQGKRSTLEYDDFKKWRDGLQD
ncbi:AMMECR1 domain-containing protein [Dactylonectria estremocensis]|uniref:AMMECR1 domain-containing protein n=1 Tax=Dactylonectria estremocensis TaxID=1079267 RepID=A0A9P9JC47_9HYPO|nr:AMMECR1 domain-containing protein [Dactylonectria estremocensis]